MKKILLLTTVIAGSLLVFKPAAAQFHASINIGVQPAWGPSGYDYAENYYLPEVEAYYSVPRHQFVYFDGANWVFSASLPGRYNSYDLYTGYKVVLNERDPWFHFNDHRARYAPYRFRHDQVVIRDRRNYGRVGSGRPAFDNRGRSNNRVYNNRRDNNYQRQDRGHDNHGHDRGHGGRGHGR